MADGLVGITVGRAADCSPVVEDDPVEPAFWSVPLVPEPKEEPEDGVEYPLDEPMGALVEPPMPVEDCATAAGTAKTVAAKQADDNLIMA